MQEIPFSPHAGSAHTPLVQAPEQHCDSLPHETPLDLHEAQEPPLQTPQHCESEEHGLPFGLQAQEPLLQRPVQHCEESEQEIPFDWHGVLHTPPVQLPEQQSPAEEHETPSDLQAHSPLLQ